VLAKEYLDAKIYMKYIPVMLNYDKKKFPKNLLAIKITPTIYIVDYKSEKIEEKIVGYNNRSAFLHLLKK
jgi:hypothetical protein